MATTHKPFVVKHGLEISGNTSITGSILPSSNNVYDLGSVEMVWRDVFIGPGSLYVNGKKVIEDDSDTITIKTDVDQNLKVVTGGTGITQIESDSQINLTGRNFADITIQTASGNIEMNGTVQIASGKRITDSAGTKVEFGDAVEMNGNKIIGLGTPTSAGDAASKDYVDTLIDSSTGAAGATTLSIQAVDNRVDNAQANILATNTAIRAELTSQVAALQTYADLAEADAKSYADTQDATLQATLESYTDAAVAGIIDAAPGALDTLNELAAAIGDDANFASTVTNSLATKLDSASYTAADVLTKVKTVDGAGSGLDADVLDGEDGTYYLDWTNTTNKPSPTVALSGDVTGSAVMTSMGSVTITATVADDSHNHVIANVDGLQTALNAKAENSVTLTAGSGLAGGGDLTANRSFSVDSDLRGVSWMIGRDTNDYINVGTTTIDFALDGNIDMRLENDGDLHVDGNVIAYSSTISDERLKSDIETVENALEKVKAMRGVTFTYNHDGKKSAGVVAQELEEVMPSAITETTLPLVDGEGEETYKTVQYDQIHAVLIEAIKELTARVEELSK